MNAYNVKITEFDNSIRFTTYDKPIKYGNKKKKTKKSNNNEQLQINDNLKDIYDLGFKRYKTELSLELTNGQEFDYVTDDEIKTYHRDGYFHYMIDNMEELKAIMKKAKLNKKIRELRKKKLSAGKYERDSLSRAIQKAYNYGFANEWEWFVTLTFSKEKTDRKNYECVTNKLSTWLKNIRKENPDMSYLVVPEKHKKDGFHFHALINNAPNIDFIKSGKLSYGKYKVTENEPLPIWVKDKTKLRTIYNINNYKLGWTTATKIENPEKATGYILKYLNKELGQVVPKGKKKYWNSKNLKLPKEEKILIPLQEIIKVGKGENIKFIKKNPLHSYIAALKKSNPKFMKEIEVTGDYENKINIIEFKKENENLIPTTNIV